MEVVMGMKILTALLACVMVFGCASGVQRVDTGEDIDLSGRWNDTDSRLVSEEMIKDSMDRPWLGDFKRKHNDKPPVVVVGSIRNRSHEHINVQTFVKDLERALLNSGEVEFVASSGERDEVRDERVDQAKYATEETAKALAEETGADFMLIGTINTIFDRAAGSEVKFYQVNLELIQIETNKKVWIGEKKIKKFVRRSRYGR